MQRVVVDERREEAEVAGKAYESLPGATGFEGNARGGEEGEWERKRDKMEGEAELEGEEDGGWRGKGGEGRQGGYTGEKGERQEEEPRASCGRQWPQACPAGWLAAALQRKSGSLQSLLSLVSLVLLLLWLSLSLLLL